MPYQNLCLGLENLTATEISYYHKVHLTKIGRPSDQSDGVSTHRLSNEKVYTERIDCSPTYFLLLEIMGDLSQKSKI